MSSSTTNRQKKRQALQGDDAESQEAARQIAEVAAQVARARNDATEATDDEVPMLTEELDHARAADDAELADAEVQFSDGPVSEEDWNEIALLVQKNVMKSMTRRTDEFVDGDLRNQLDELLDRGAERLMADIKNTLQQTISEAVSEAIAQELSHARKEVRRTENSN